MELTDRQRDRRAIMFQGADWALTGARLGQQGLSPGASLGFRQNGLTGLSWNRRIDQHDQESKRAVSVDLQDVRSAKLQACMKSAEPTMH